VKNAKKSLITMVSMVLLITMIFPAFLIRNANASSSNALGTPVYYMDGVWWRIETDLITILFPASGKKPMFLWWYSNDTNNVYVVKYKGLIEYLTIDYPYYVHKYEANALTMQKKLEAKYAIGVNQNQIRNEIHKYMPWFLSFHPAYLPFSACQWNLTKPENVTRPDGVSYISFNFTLTRAPKNFKFAENNVIIRCRFYITDATENVYGLYNYTVRAGELKMDFVVKNWEWNIDKLDDLFWELHSKFGIVVPKMRAGLALWIDLSSIQIVDLPIAEEDINFTLQSLPENSYSAPIEPVETRSKASDMIVKGQRVHVRENKLAMNAYENPIPLNHRVHERCKLRFAKGSQTLAGFFDFINKAVIIDPITGDLSLVNVTAAYISAGSHMRLFIGYPYFGDNILEHDPSIGVETVTPWLPANLLMILIGTTVLIAVAVAAVKIRKKTVNIINL